MNFSFTRKRCEGRAKISEEQGYPELSTCSLCRARMQQPQTKVYKTQGLLTHSYYCAVSCGIIAAFQEYSPPCRLYTRGVRTGRESAASGKGTVASKLDRDCLLREKQRSASRETRPKNKRPPHSSELPHSLILIWDIMNLDAFALDILR